jgi:hypothetical protein
VGAGITLGAIAMDRRGASAAIIERNQGELCRMLGIIIITMGLFIAVILLLYLIYLEKL